MSIEIRYFASLRERLGRHEDRLDFQAGIDVAGVWEAANPNRPMPPNLLCAVNHEYADLDRALEDGDEVAFFPPVTGG